ncbi:hypothetical protein V1504DRAFT_456737 [Lipomyces starkeyi]
MSELYYNLASRLHDTNSSAGDPAPMRFQGGDSYIRCTAHVLNLIINDILSALDAGDHKSAIYQKYYNYMDGQDAYYIALILDARFKTLLCTSSIP